MPESTIEIDECLSALACIMSKKCMTVDQALKDGAEALALKYKDILSKQADLKEQEFCNSEAYLIDSLELQIEALKAEIQAKDLLICALDLQIETYETTSQLSKVAYNLNEKVLDAQENEIVYKTTKIDKYQKGPKKKSLDSQQKWALANEYFKEEIPLHRTLKAARLAAAKKARIVAEERQLTKMMPNPR